MVKAALHVSQRGVRLFLESTPSAPKTGQLNQSAPFKAGNFCQDEAGWAQSKMTPGVALIAPTNDSERFDAGVTALASKHPHLDGPNVNVRGKPRQWETEMFSAFVVLPRHPEKAAQLIHSKGSEHNEVRSYEVGTLHRPSRSTQKRHGIHQRKKLFVDPAPISFINTYEHLSGNPVHGSYLDVSLEACTNDRTVGSPLAATANPSIVCTTTFFHKPLTTQRANRESFRKFVLQSLSLQHLSDKPGPWFMGPPSKISAGAGMR